MVGLVLEKALQLEFAAKLGSLPVSLSRQKAVDHTSVHLHHVVTPGGTRQKMVQVAVPAADALLAIDLAQRVVAKLEDGDLQLQILDVDKYDERLGVSASGDRRSHDVIAKTTRRSGQRQGLVSVEIRCREVQLGCFESSPPCHETPWRTVPPR